MKIDEIRIKNFRSIKDVKISIKDYTALVGKNNVGKSNILRALNSFFNFELEKDSFLRGDHYYCNKTTPRIEIIFDSEERTSILQSITTNNKITISFKFLRKYKEAEYLYKKGKQFEDLLGQKKVAFFEAFHFVLIPTPRDHQKIHELENGILKKIILKVLQKKQKNNLKKHSDEIKNKFRQIFHDVESFIKSSSLMNLNSKLDFYNNVNIRDFLSDQIKVNIVEKGKTLLPKDCGTGIQSLLLITLYKYHADLSDSNYLMAIEEPEVNLHPQAQLNLMTNLRSLIEGKCIQIIVTTHSPHIIDSLEHTNITLCQKSKKSQKITTECYQLGSDYWERNKLIRIKNDSFFKYKNSDFFFADRVIVCEGISDSEVLKFLANQSGLNLSLKGITILTLGGKNNLNYPLSLVKELKIPYLIILDKDFFLPYRDENKLQKSRNKKFFPLYAPEFHKNKLFLIKKLIPNLQDREKLKKLLISNHSQAMTLLQRYSIVSFKWSLEVDLVNSSSARKEYLAQFKIKDGTNEYEELLEKRLSSNKDCEKTISVIKKIEHSNLPNSYKRIKKIFSQYKKYNNY